MVDLPSKNGDLPVRFLYVYQRVRIVPLERMIVPFASHGCSPRYELHHWNGCFHAWNARLSTCYTHPIGMIMASKIRKLYLCLPTQTYHESIYKPSTFFGYHQFFCILSPKTHLLVKNPQKSQSQFFPDFYASNASGCFEGPLFFGRHGIRPVAAPPRPGSKKMSWTAFDWRWIFVETSKVRCFVLWLDGNHLVNDGMGLTWFNHITI